MILFVSSISDEGVAVNTGGACGGFLNARGAIVAVVRGLIEEDVGMIFSGWICWKMADTLEPNLIGRARTRAIETKRETAASRSFVERGTARLTVRPGSVGDEVNGGQVIEVCDGRHRPEFM